MAKYKAKAGFNKLEDKFFGVHKIKALENGAVLEITDISVIPKKVMECLQEVNEQKVKEKKGDK